MTKHIILCSLLFMASCLCSQNSFGYALNIEIIPDKVNGLVYNDVLLSCGLDDGDTGVKEVLALVLSKGEKAVAILRQNSRLTIGKDFNGKFQADGGVSATVRESYLRVILSNPWMEDDGEYVCRLYFLNEVGIFAEKRNSANLTVTDKAVPATLKHLVEKVSELETELTTQRAVSSKRLNRLEKEFTEIESQLQARISLLAEQVKVQEERLQQQAESLVQAVERENKTEFFYAVHTTEGTFQPGKILAYSEVIASEGQGYNKYSGVFTAPVDGYYMFCVSAFMANGNYIFFDLKTSTGQTLSRLRIGRNVGGWSDYADGTGVVKLEAGEQVMPVIHSISSSFKLARHDSGGYLNRFFGYLLKTV